MDNDEEIEAWDKLKKDPDINSWLKWQSPHYSDTEIARTIYVAIVIAGVLALLFFIVNRITT